MKKVIAIILTACLCLLCSCSNNTEKETTTIPVSTTEETPVYVYFDEPYDAVPKPDSVSSKITFNKISETEDGQISHSYKYEYEDAEEAFEIKEQYLKAISAKDGISSFNVYRLDDISGVWKVEVNEEVLDCLVVFTPGAITINFPVNETETTVQ